MEVNKEKLDSYLKTLNTSTCPLCGGRKWVASTVAFYLGEYFEDKIVIGTSSLPVIPITCLKCGNTYFINALVSGLIEKNMNQEKDNQDKI